MNINKIEIFNNNLSLVIFPKEEKVLVGKISRSISVEEIEEFLDIIMYWDHNYYSNRGLDGVRFDIKIYYEDKIDEYKGVRSLPNNYKEFDTFVRKLYYGR